MASVVNDSGWGGGTSELLPFSPTALPSPCDLCTLKLIVLLLFKGLVISKIGLWSAHQEV